MKIKLFLNLITGEIIVAKNKLHAYKMFRADGKKFNYRTPLRKIVYWASAEVYAHTLEEATEYDA